MPKPIINGIGIAVHKTKVFRFAIKGTNISIGDSVKLAQSISGVKYEWTGSIVAREPGKDNYVAEITVPPSGYPGGQNDVGDVTISISNGGETSIPHVEIIVVDDP